MMMSAREPAARPRSCLSEHRLRLLQPVGHAHLAVHRRRDGELLVRVLAPACAPVELAEAQMAVGDEGTHAEFLRQGHGLAVVRHGLPDLRAGGMGGDLGQYPETVGLPAAPALMTAELEGATGQTLGLARL